MATVSSTAKFTLKYKAKQDSQETVTRSISGLNVKSGQEVTTGPFVDTAIGNFYSYIINAFSTATINGLSWVRESEVII